MLRPDELTRLAAQPEVNVLVFADSHGSSDFILRMIACHPTADLVIHLGDHCDLLSELALDDLMPITGVAGNCDGWAGRHLPAEQLLILAGRRVFLTHGHLFDVKHQLKSIVQIAAGEPYCADIILFGHTHRQLERRIKYQGRNIVLINPGSSHISFYGHPASAAWLQITPDHVTSELLLDQT